MFIFKTKIGSSEQDTGPTLTTITLPAKGFDNKTHTKIGVYLFRKSGGSEQDTAPTKISLQ